uniref:AB hydrolase-1 domain-containing protein n=1 Tax=Arundo donax TaxID=35708 RepID=A0A0A9DCE2_ARUDO
MPAADPPAAVAPDDEGVPRRPLSLASVLLGLFYLAAAVPLLALLLPRLLIPFSSLVGPLRHRPIIIYSGELKLDPCPGFFAVISHPERVAPTHRVLILPGLAAGSFSFRHVYRSLAYRGLLVAVLDLPGWGYSPAPPAPIFKRLFRAGEPRALSPAEAAAAVARAVEVLGLGGVAPVHLVLHDSALAAGAAFASANPAAVRSVTLIDAAASEPAFPAPVFGMPVLGKLVLWVPPLFHMLLRLCCVRGWGGEDARWHRAAMLVDGTAEGVVEAWKTMNPCFELGEWRVSSEEVRKLPMMVLWSGAWSNWWIDEGKKVAAALPDAKFIYHSGGRWPQEDASEEISALLTKFVTSFEEAAGGYVEWWQASYLQAFNPQSATFTLVWS